LESFQARKINAIMWQAVPNIDNTLCKNVALAVQQECGLSILYGCPRVVLETLN